MNNIRSVIQPQLSERIKNMVEEVKKGNIELYNVTAQDLVLDDIENLSKGQLEAAKIQAEKANQILENIRKKLLE